MAMPVVHLYCTIVDNFGDIGVCWRLARQLAYEYGWVVYLWVDDWLAARQIIPELPVAPARTAVAGVQVQAWAQVDPAQDCTGDVLIEGFACTLPDGVLAQLAARPRKPTWINLDYFSAEGWVERFHLQSGYDAAMGTRRWFFFPGVHPHPRSGGLLRERDLLAQRNAWQTQRDAPALLAGLNVPWQAEALHVLCFGYRHAPYAEWVAAFADLSRPVALWLCGGYTQSALRDVPTQTWPSIHVQAMPFVAQPVFDQLLWSADIAFVRGEDSLVRALWSGRPFVWQIYPQDKQAHLPKLLAWLGFYAALFPDDLRAAYIDVHVAWNALHLETLDGGVLPFAPAWQRLMQLWPHWQAWSHRRSAECAQDTDLAQRLVDFVNSTV